MNCAYLKCTIWYVHISLQNHNCNQDNEHITQKFSYATLKSFLPTHIQAFPISRQRPICAVSVNLLAFSGILCKCNHTIWTFSWVPYYTPHNDVEIVHSFLLLNSTLFMNLQLFFHFSIDEDSGCFQFLVIANKAVRNTDVQMLVWTHTFLLDKHLEWNG